MSKQHIHILGICGTFMGGIAAIAREAGYTVSGVDANVYPPMSTQLEKLGIELSEGYAADNIRRDADVQVVGNAMSRGNPVTEAVLNENLKYTSGPQWLSEQVLQHKWVLAVAGTHGKTTTSSMLAWILEWANMSPGFLIGGVPGNFDVSARLGGSDFFVIEADEYDTAFFDKRSKFVHYRPRTLVLNNLEFDHADIFDDLDAIKRQFHHVIRTVPENGMLISNADEPNLDDTLAQGAWTPVQRFGKEGGWQAELVSADGSAFKVIFEGAEQGEVRWDTIGQHNVSNALAAIAAARHVGVRPQDSIRALAEFKGVKRRMEVKGEANGIRVYDDFAHHPTAIETTVAGLRNKVGSERILAVFEPRSNSLRAGAHSEGLGASLAAADEVFVLEPDELNWSVSEAMQSLGDKLQVAPTVSSLAQRVAASWQPGDHVLVMSNGGFGGIHQQLLDLAAESA
ncbi:MAG: UDP-N-acetylmuramate:L-alanyl-gamma-D-glutamyl-meso-diaminopimelate ligase [Gammaproteobacteria bacterium]|nr:UDP-N-acetylmuramate:L-alanyl-gamma-D-glutamyl-meso-diaminopimelate ligase [Gammaproteobacteria bacterium]